MRLLAIDPGAERCGWAILEPGPTYIDSGIFRYPRNKQDFQPYRIALENEAFTYFTERIKSQSITHVVNEIVPAVGGGNFVVATQSYLANCVVTSIHNAAFKLKVAVAQIAARTVHKLIAMKTKAKKVTKVHVRNGVIEILPELKPRVSDWVKEFDESDAIAIGLAYLMSYN